jgi:hypothetical protein
VRRNLSRFPADFAFQICPEEAALLISQSVISSSDWGGSRHLPYAFTEQGVAMLSGILRSPRPVLVNVEIMRSFVRLRRLLAPHANLARKLTELEQKYDAQFRVVFDAIRALMEPLQEGDPPSHWVPVGAIPFLDGIRDSSLERVHSRSTTVDSPKKLPESNSSGFPAFSRDRDESPKPHI